MRIPTQTYGARRVSGNAVAVNGAGGVQLSICSPCVLGKKICCGLFGCSIKDC